MKGVVTARILQRDDSVITDSKGLVKRQRERASESERKRELMEEGTLTLAIGEMAAVGALELPDSLLQQRGRAWPRWLWERKALGWALTAGE